MTLFESYFPPYPKYPWQYKSWPTMGSHWFIWGKLGKPKAEPKAEPNHHQSLWQTNTERLCSRRQLGRASIKAGKGDEEGDWDRDQEGDLGREAARDRPHKRRPRRSRRPRPRPSSATTLSMPLSARALGQKHVVEIMKCCRHHTENCTVTCRQSKHKKPAVALSNGVEVGDGVSVGRLPSHGRQRDTRLIFTTHVCDVTSTGSARLPTDSSITNTQRARERERE